jgi:hypothetical protein
MRMSSMTTNITIVNPASHQQAHPPTISPTPLWFNQQAGRKRFAFEMQFNPEMLADYTHDHEHVWPEMCAAIRARGM